MTPQDEIAKLAREYAEEIRKDILPFFHQPLPDSMEVLVQKDQKEAERLIRFLLRTHCIVSKEKVKGAYDEANQGDAYDRFDNGYNLGVVDTLESLFDAETFKNSEV